jgi:hypothetical protein
MESHYRRLKRWEIAGLLALPLMLYVHYRAAVLAFTYDECWTFLGYARSDLWSVLTNAQPAANNHIFHSLLMMPFAYLFGFEEYALRIPALVGFFGFVYFLYRLSVAMFDRMWWTAFVILLFQPYLLDYFGMARGYSLALAAMTGGLYYAGLWMKNRRRSTLRMTWLMLWLAAYSNFTYLLVGVAIGLVIFWMGWRTDRGYMLVSSLIVSTWLFFTCAYPIEQLIQAKELYYGGSNGFFTDTLLSLAHKTMYDRMDGAVLAVVFALIMCGALYVILQTFRNPTFMHKEPWGLLVSATLVLASVGSVAQHYFFGSPYLIDRTALFLLPLLILTATWLILRHIPEGLGWAFGSLTIALVVLNFTWSMNYSYQLDFKEYADVDKAIQIIDQETDARHAFRLGKSVYMNAPIMYYARKYEVEQIQPAGLEFCDEAGPTPFIYLFEKDIHCVDGRAVDLFRYFPTSNTFLYRVEEP